MNGGVPGLSSRTPGGLIPGGLIPGGAGGALGCFTGGSTGGPVKPPGGGSALVVGVPS